MLDRIWQAVWRSLIAGSSMTAMDATLSPQEAELAAIIVETLNLEVAPAQIRPDTPLYGEGLGLDSIDMLEIALVVSQRYGVNLRADNEDNAQIFQSLRCLTRYIQTHRDG